jgi:hypothetical protein
MLVGFSRLARLDLSCAVWTTGAFFAYLMAQRLNLKRWAMLAGASAALGLATNPYGGFLVLALLAIKILYGKRANVHDTSTFPWYAYLLPNRLDWAVIFSWGLVYVLVYPNLWPNPVVGLYRVIQLALHTPHARGEVSSNMPVSHWFYLLRSPEHILPWTLGLCLLGLAIGIRSRRRDVLLLLIWGISILTLLSIPPGRKNLKNFLLVMPSVVLLAGFGIDQMLNWITRFEILPKRFVHAGAALLLLFAGLYKTTLWFPYPQAYTWPWRPDPQTLPVRELVGEGEGIKEGIEYIRQKGPPRARIGCFTGKNNAAYYYDEKLLGSPVHPNDLRKFDWLVVLPKLTFGSPDNNPLVHWVRSHDPTYIVYIHQIELVRMYRLDPASF